MQKQREDLRQRLLKRRAIRCAWTAAKKRHHQTHHEKTVSTEESKADKSTTSSKALDKDTHGNVVINSEKCGIECTDEQSFISHVNQQIAERGKMVRLVLFNSKILLNRLTELHTHVIPLSLRHEYFDRYDCSSHAFSHDIAALESSNSDGVENMHLIRKQFTELEAEQIETLSNIYAILQDCLSAVLSYHSAADQRNALWLSLPWRLRHCSSVASSSSSGRSKFLPPVPSPLTRPALHEEDAPCAKKMRAVEEQQAQEDSGSV